jgi:biotin carboxyl carrier protein
MLKNTLISAVLIASLLISLSACTKESQQEEEVVAEVVSEQSANEELSLSNDSVPIAQTIECAGKVHLPPQAMFSIHAKVEGYVKDVKLIEGQPVKKGNILAIIESPSFAIIQKEFLKSCC